MTIKIFTSTDALVIIFVTGLLATIIAPSIGSARDKARQKGCTGNMKQIGTAMIMYFSDGSETHFPSSSSSYFQNYETAIPNDPGDVWELEYGTLSCMAKRNNTNSPKSKVYSYCSEVAGASFKFMEDPQTRIATESSLNKDGSVKADTHKTGGRANILAGDGHIESGPGGFAQNRDGL